MTEGADPNHGSDTATTLESSRFPRLSRVRVSADIAVLQLSHARGRTILTVLDITPAVLVVTLLAGTGVDVTQTSQQQFDAAGRDVWTTGGPVRFSPTGVGGFENSIIDAHGLDAELGAHEDVKVVTPVSFQTAYIRSSESDYGTLVGVGAPARDGLVQITNGSDFNRPNVHYAGGNYTGPITHKVVIDQRTIEMINVSIGDPLYVSSTTGTVRENGFIIVGVSPAFSRFLGTPSAVAHLNELQEVTGSTGTGTTTLMTLTVADGADPETVMADIQTDYPDYDVWADQEQLTEILRDRAVVMAADGNLIFLALLAGLALSVNVLLSRVYHQRRELTVLKTLGTSPSTLSLTLVAQTLVLGTSGGLLGVALPFPAAVGLNRLAQLFVGFGDVAVLPRTMLTDGFAIAFVVSLVSSLTVSRRIAGIRPLDHL